MKTLQRQKGRQQEKHNSGRHGEPITLQKSKTQPKPTLHRPKNSLILSPPTKTGTKAKGAQLQRFRLTHWPTSCTASTSPPTPKAKLSSSEVSEYLFSHGAAKSKTESLSTNATHHPTRCGQVFSLGIQPGKHDRHNNKTPRNRKRPLGLSSAAQQNAKSLPAHTVGPQKRKPNQPSFNLPG